MIAYISYRKDHRSPSISRRVIAGAAFPVLSYPWQRHPAGPLSRRMALLWAGRLKREGVRSAVFPLDFPYTALFIRQGILPADPLPLQMALAPHLVRRRLDALGLEPTRAVVALSGQRLTAELADAARMLALAYRYVFLDVPSGGEGFARSLRRSFGVSLLLDPSPVQLQRADALLLYTPRTDLSLDHPVCYALYPGAGEKGIPLRLPVAAAAAVDANTCQEQLAFALFAQRKLTLDQFLAEIPC